MIKLKRLVYMCKAFVMSRYVMMEFEKVINRDYMYIYLLKITIV